MSYVLTWFILQCMPQEQSSKVLGWPKVFKLSFLSLLHPSRLIWPEAGGRKLSASRKCSDVHQPHVQDRKAIVQNYFFKPRQTVVPQERWGMAYLCNQILTPGRELSGTCLLCKQQANCALSDRQCKSVHAKPQMFSLLLVTVIICLFSSARAMTSLGRMCCRHKSQIRLR